MSGRGDSSVCSDSQCSEYSCGYFSGDGGSFGSCGDYGYVCEGMRGGQDSMALARGRLQGSHCSQHSRCSQHSSIQNNSGKSNTSHAGVTLTSHAGVTHTSHAGVTLTSHAGVTHTSHAGVPHAEGSEGCLYIKKCQEITFVILGVIALAALCALVIEVLYVIKPSLVDSL